MSRKPLDFGLRYTKPPSEIYQLARVLGVSMNAIKEAVYVCQTFSMKTIGEYLVKYDLIDQYWFDHCTKFYNDNCERKKIRNR